jgi:hypothetical protein
LQAATFIVAIIIDIIAATSTTTTPPYFVQLRIAVALHRSQQSSSIHDIDTQNRPEDTTLDFTKFTISLAFFGGVGLHLSLLAVYPWAALGSVSLFDDLRDSRICRAHFGG